MRSWLFKHNFLLVEKIKMPINCVKCALKIKPSTALIIVDMFVYAKNIYH